MKKKERRDVPAEKIIEVKRAVKKIDFSKKYKFIYFDWWFDILTFPLFLSCCIMAFFCRFFFGFRVYNRKNLKALKKRGCITISNHCHYFDTVFASLTVFPRRLYVSVVQRNFEVPLVRLILRFVRAFPIPSHPVGFKMITDSVGEALKRGYHVHFLPEGELVVYSQEIFRFRPGAFYQAYLHQAPVVPFVYVITPRKGMGKAWIKMRMIVGESLYPPPLRTDGAFPKEELDEMMEKAASWMEDTIRDYHEDNKIPESSRPVRQEA